MDDLKGCCLCAHNLFFVNVLSFSKIECSMHAILTANYNIRTVDFCILNLCLNSNT